MENRSGLFRQEALNNLSAPEDLNQVLRVVNPSSWVILLAILLIMAGFFAWSMVGSVDKKVVASAQVSNGVAHFTVKDYELKSGMPVKVGDTESSMRDIGRNNDGNYIAAANVPGMTDGVYEAQITVEHLSPITFLFN